MLYPTNFGLNNCAAHSTNLAPYCADAAGRPLPGRPDWCNPGNQWCYVDTDYCRDAQGNYMMSSRSSYFPGASMYYSYGTCGGARNTFDAWASSTTECTMDEALGLVETLENYVNSTALTLERSWETYSGYDTIPQCNDHKSCPNALCYECQPAPNWNYPVDFAGANERWRCGESQTSREAREMVCMAREVEGAWNQVAQKEYDDTSRVAFQYFGTQDIGGFAQWPWGQYCTGTYDPRFRPWYATAASGPKDVVIIVDTSGSMASGSRVEMAKGATLKVIDTLAWTDYATVVTFGSSAESKSSVLEPMNDDNKANLKLWTATNIHSSGGGTNFAVAFATAFQVFDSSTDSSTSSGSNCEKVILFMTDGESTDYDYQVIQSEATRLGVRIFSYTLGNGADQTVPKNIACQNGGVFQHVPDCGDLGSAMAGYFKLLAAGISKIRHPKPRWVNYYASSTGDEVLSGCLPVFKNEGAAPGQVRELLGATCIDLNIIVPISTLRTMDCWGDFWTRVTTETRTCTPYTLTESELETLRATIAPEAVCMSSSGGSDYCTVQGTNSNTPECQNRNDSPANGDESKTSRARVARPLSRATIEWTMIGAAFVAMCVLY